jgi:DUF4097 and DUF4098 domain-containing protein YvlB
MSPHRLTLVAACATLLTMTAFAYGEVTSISVSFDDDGPIEGCDDIRIHFGDREHPRAMVREEEKLEGRTSTLRAALSAHGHVIVRGWDDDRTSILVCKAAGGRSESAAGEILAKISATFRGDTLSLSGPTDEEWVTYFVVRVPRRAALDLEATNGSIRVADLAGSVRARSVNGPVSVSDCTGEVDARVQNGPIDLRGGEGRATLRAENGPIAVTLSGNRWRGEALDARTQNGPVSLTIPAGYASGVEVETGSYGPFSCDADACREAAKTWDDSRRIRFGGSPVVVRLATVNGPVSIGAPKD